MFQHIKKIEESKEVEYVNTALSLGWVLLEIVKTDKGFLYVIGLPYFNVKE